jgi:sterol desaturase/sphingolipid hydroxylase (fatty acid hydroxylase superfamily)
MVPEMIIITLAMVTVLNGFGVVLSYWIVLKKPSANKLQDRPYTLSTLNGRMPLILFNLATIYAVSYIGLTLFGGFLVMESIPWWLVFLQCWFISFCDDTYFFFFHRWLHLNKTLYRKIHKIHHKAFSPIPIEYIYVHPLEWMVGAIAPVSGMVIVGLFSGELNFWVFWVYSALRTIHELDIHSGFRSKWARFIPLLGHAEHHDLHHAKPHIGNYAATYVFWDRLFGSEIKG